MNVITYFVKNNYLNSHFKNHFLTNKKNTMKKRQGLSLLVLAFGIIMLAASCGPTTNTMIGYVEFGNPTSGPSTGGPVKVDSTPTTQPSTKLDGTGKTIDKNALSTGNADSAKEEKGIKRAAPNQEKPLPATSGTPVSCLGEGMCAKPASSVANASANAIPVTFSYTLQTPNSISLIFKLADITNKQPGQVGGLADGSQYIFAAPITLDDPMYIPLGMQGTMMIPAAAGTVKNDGTTVTITMPLVPAAPTGPATTGQ